MIASNTFFALEMMIGFGLLFPLLVAYVWIKTQKEKVSTVLTGAATWFLFAVILEAIPKFFLFNSATSIGSKVMSSPVLYVVFGILLAGIFEETGRFIAFRTVLKNRKNRETGVSHGIGHGGMEAAWMMIISGIQYMVYATMINNGTFDSFISQNAAAGIDTSALEAMPAAIAQITPVVVLISMFERIYAMLMHVSLSILVFNAVKRKRTDLYFLAIALHAILDLAAALYQVGAIGLVATEVIGCTLSAACFIVIYIKFYKTDVSEA